MLNLHSIWFKRLCRKEVCLSIGKFNNDCHFTIHISYMIYNHTSHISMICHHISCMICDMDISRDIWNYPQHSAGSRDWVFKGILHRKKICLGKSHSFVNNIWFWQIKAPNSTYLGPQGPRPIAPHGSSIRCAGELGTKNWVWGVILDPFDQNQQNHTL